MLPTIGRVPPCIARELFRERRLSEKSLTGLVLICQKRGMWWYHKELPPDEMLCRESKTAWRPASMWHGCMAEE